MSKEFINSFFELCLCLFEGYLYLTFWNHFLERRFRGKGKTVFMIFGAYLLPAASIVTFMGLAYSDTGAMRESPAGMLITTGSILIFLANIFLLGLYDRLSRVSNEMRKYERLENTNMLKQDHYVQMEKIQQQVHNITFYMQTIRALALEENWEKLIQLTREWDETAAEKRRDGENHGMGIRYVTETAEHYGGTVSFRAENGTFTATVLFQQEKLSAKKK